MSPLNRETPKPQLAAELDAEHEHLERCYLDLTERAATGECRECDSVWTDFTQKLEDHMAFEEREIFPRYAQRGAAEADLVRGLLAEHAAIRSQLQTMGVDLQLHLTDATDIDSLLQALRDHARRERQFLYPALTA